MMEQPEVFTEEAYETVVNSMQAFAKLAAEYGLKAAE